MADPPPFAWPQGKQCAVSVTFDDARPSQVAAGFPILDRHGVRGTFYVMSARVAERHPDWLAAVERGHEAGNHSMKHPCSGNFAFSRARALEDYTLAQMEAEILEASDAIEKLLKIRPKTFAYPCAQTFVGRGLNHQSYVPIIARHFVVGRWGFNEISSDPNWLDLALVTSLSMDDISWEAALKLIEFALKEGRWLILTGHDVGQDHWQSVRSDTLDKICQYCQDESNGVWIDTVAAVGEYIRKNRSVS
jgi:peptidoglycan/xylan/chitin deacetylase (PgdA/CDA1 family)